MSDHDEMDVDVPPIVSASDEPKGKRSAANLPVEAEDSLPWLAPLNILHSSHTHR